MKRTVRPLFSILILIVFAVTFSCRNVVRLGLISFEQDTNVVAVHKPATHVFNATLLKFAAMDPGEAHFKQEIEQLLEGNFGSRRTYRTFATWRRFHHHDMRSRSSTGLPVSLNSPEFYRYWLDFRRILHDWARKRKFQPDIMSELLSMVKQPLDMHIGLASQNQRYSTCAVVGNSGILLQSDYGKLIDSHAFVIRLNNARVDAYERKVGSKTSISFINSNILHLCARREGCYCHPYGFEVPIVMYICQPVHFLDYTICNSSHKLPLVVTDPRFDVLCSRVVKYYSLKRFMEQTGKSLEEWSTAHDGPMFHYSSGVQAVMLAVGICDKVSIFGFGKVASAKHHYHTNQKSELSLHDYEAEYAFYHDLIEKPREIPFISDKFKNQFAARNFNIIFPHEVLSFICRLPTQPRHPDLLFF